MTATSPCPVIDRLVEALNAHDEDAAAAYFTPKAVVRDGGLEYRGSAAIRHWMQEAFEKYALHLEVTEISGPGPEWTFEARVSGTFEGSPVLLEHRVALSADKITNLEI